MSNIGGLAIYIFSLAFTFTAGLFMLPSMLVSAKTSIEALPKIGNYVFGNFYQTGLSIRAIENRDKYPFFSLVLLLFVSILAAFRGNAGIDTNLYIIRFQNINFRDIFQLEPLIPLMMWTVKICGGSFVTFSLFYAFVLSFLYYYILKRYPNSIYFGISILPVIFIDSLYNGVRIGLAYPLIIISIAGSSTIMLIVSSMAHITSLVAGFFKVMPWYKYVILFVLVVIVLAYTGIPAYEQLPYRYAKKISIYQTKAPSNIYSGLADSVALMFALLIYFRVSRIKKKKSSELVLAVFLTVIGFLFFFIIRQYTAGLRIVRLLIICIFGLIARSDKKYDKISFEICILFGIIYTLNFIRQIYSSYYYSDGGFLPLNLTF